MAINIRNSEAPIREFRLGAISGYNGTVTDLVEKSSGCSLKNRERCFSQSTSCSAGCAQGYLSGIIDAAIINHAPVGCAADAIYSNVTNKWGNSIRDWKHKNIHFASTNLNEQDTVFGATGKLRQTIEEIYQRYHPKVIFVTTSCVSGIIGEDIQSTLDELADDIPVPLVPVFCEGFKSKVWASGFDAAFHAILTGVVKPPEKKTNFVNMINFRGSARKEIIEMFAQFGVEPLFVAPFSTVEQLSRVSESAATVSICGTLGSYLGNGLEQEYGVPYVKSLQPHGVAGIKSWLRGLGQAIGKETEVEAYIAKEEERIAPALEKLRAKLRGTKAVVGMGPSYGHNYIRVLNELGIEVIWGATWHYDQQYDHGALPESVKHVAQTQKDLPISVCDQQNFEIINLLNRLRPDIYISRHSGSAMWANKLGIPSIPIIDEYTAFGFNGLISFGQRIHDTLTNRSFAKNLAKRTRLPYTDWWMKQNHFALLEEAAE
ncbi:nitrogenase component 1 [Heliophilum fasciatum]|uniref:Nitrogenase molybdenum-iron protein alpha chain n=1 Tax=Heliophilum fasciatum TaxID=35700 RepID=A0A4R2RYG2_9FIRM|nr:nitrogenase component 1 [Heliophilum fasciatum]MCW2277694.1 nitrogenase molybdenum-iron protein alpha chain [Heliophilum fasciatum]TCP65041.1 nitrogenase molybdenum-iron protein alpha chain [Heliophilum fasciatum]